MSKKAVILIGIESTIIVLLAVGLFFVTRHYNKVHKEYLVTQDSGKRPHLYGQHAHDPSAGAHRVKAEDSHQMHIDGSINNLQDSVPAVPVEITRVKRKDMDIFLLTNCTLEAERQIDIFSKTGGEVEQILIEEGEGVQAEGLLAELDKKEAILSLNEAGVKLANTRLIYERSIKTYNDKIISKEEFEGYKLNYETAQVEHEKKKLELDYYTIRSPIQGVVVGRHIDIGDNVKKEQILFTVANFDRIYAKVYVPEKYLNKIKEGQTAYVTVESIPDLRFEGTVRLINPVVESKSGTIKVTVEITDKRIALLRPGMFVSVHIIIDQHPDALIIPKKALIMDSITDEVFVVKYLIKTALPEEIVKMVSPGNEARVNLLSLPKKRGSDELSDKPILGRVVDITDKVTFAETDAKEWRSFPLVGSTTHSRSQMTVELIETSDLKLDMDGAIAEINILNTKGESSSLLPEVVLKVEPTAFKTQVKLGFSEGNEVEVMTGLNDYDKVVTVGHEDLIHGMRVFIVEG